MLINLSGEKSETLTKPKEDYSTLTAKDILHEIENPLPIKQNISVAPKPLVEGTGINLVAGKVTPPVIPQAAVVPQPENSTPIAPVPSPTTPPNIIEQKLNQTVRAPEPQKVELTTKPISKLPPLTNKSTAASGGTDPYRESF